MRLGVFWPANITGSKKLYVENIVRGVEREGARVLKFGPSESLPETPDVYWDALATGGRAPDSMFHSRAKALVVTVHGMASWSIPAREYFPSAPSAIRGKARDLIEWMKWRLLHDQESIYVITVSQFSKKEISGHLPIAEHRIIPIHHGVDESIFFPAAQPEAGRPFFLHASFYQPLKNVARIVEAYRTSALAGEIDMVLVCPGLARDKARPVRGVKWLLEPIGHELLAPLLRDARGFIFPSLRESFGLPILEAMASGCPVITASRSACREVADNAALFVNPRSVAEIRRALKRLAHEPEFCIDLRRRGLARARHFTWERSVKAHLEVFERAARAGRRRT